MILVDFGRENGAKLAPKWDQKSMLTSKGRFHKNAYKTNRILMIFEVRGVEKSIKNRSKNEVNMGRHLGIDFSSILVDFGSQVGRQIEPRSIKNGIEKTMKKRRATRWPKSRKKCLRRPAAPGVQTPGDVT